MPEILLVEDEPQLSDVVREWLEEELYTLKVISDGKRALAELLSTPYDLIILDVMLPEMNGLDICRSYRENGGLSPIIMLTAKRSLKDKETGLDSGADDYLTKPFKLRELSARIRAMLRRSTAVLSPRLIVGGLCLDLEAHRVTKDGEEVYLLPKEFVLLELLMKNAGKVLSADFLITNAWSDEKNITPDTIRSYVRSLRQKLGRKEEVSLIRTVHGVGYKIEN